jgi:hypothetical protein
MAAEPEDEGPKRAHVVLSKGCEVVGAGYSRLTGAAAKVMDKGENLGNPSRVSQDNSTDRQADRVSQNNSTDRRADRVSQVGSMESRVMENLSNTESRVIENLTNMESRVTQNSANTESRVTQNSANTKSWVTENSANTKNRVMQDSGRGGGQKTRRKKRCYFKQKASSTVVPKRY